LSVIFGRIPEDIKGKRRIGINTRHNKHTNGGKSNKKDFTAFFIPGRLPSSGIVFILPYEKEYKRYIKKITVWDCILVEHL
jgi:hypothetical protein